MYTFCDKISLEEGELKIDATALFLDYNTVSASLEYSIYENKQIVFEVEEKIYKINEPSIDKEEKNFFESSVLPTDPIIVKVAFDYGEIPTEQWESMEIPTVDLGKKLDEQNPNFMKIFNFLRTFHSVRDIRVEKSKEPGILFLYPEWGSEKTMVGTYVGREYILSINTENGKSVWQGEIQDEIQVIDYRSAWEKNWDIIIKLIGLGFLLFVLLGYTPLFKKKFPKNMKGTPTIECKPIPFGRREETLARNGEFSSTIQR